MPFEDALNFIRKAAARGSLLGLERVRRLCALAGDPQDSVPMIHVAGTNGKGSTSAMLASVLTAAGCRTGLYTSPYVENVRECLSLDGEPISEEQFACVAQEIAGYAGQMEREGDPPTEFEIETAMAFLWFLRCGCDAAVVEVGLGGRLDATNVIRSPLLSVLTSISLDHTAILGDTVDKIAFEKCGVIKPGGVTVSYPLQPGAAMDVIRRRAAEEGNPLYIPSMDETQLLRSGLQGSDIRFRGLELHVPFTGAHQVCNAVTAAQAALAIRESGTLSLTDLAITQGIAKARMPARQEVLRKDPVVLVDGAHNPDGLAALAATMRLCLGGFRTAVVMGMLADKDYEGSVALIAPLSGRFIAVEPRSPRALPAAVLAGVAKAHCADATPASSYAVALEDAFRYAGRDGAVVVCGSFYLALPMRTEYYNLEKRLVSLIS